MSEGNLVKVTEWGVRAPEGYIWASQLGAGEWCKEVALEHDHVLVKRAMIYDKDTDHTVAYGPWSDRGINGASPLDSGIEFQMELMPDV